MYTLSLLGGLTLDDGADPVSGPATQPVRLAVLVLLTVPEPRAVTRAKIVALLWPEHSARSGADPDGRRRLPSGPGERRASGGGPGL